MNVHAYAPNPVRWVDPMGLNPALAACPFGGPYNPVCDAGVIWGGITLIGLGITAMATSSSSSTSTSDARQADYEHYKRICNEPPNPRLTPCEQAKFKLRRNKQCLDLRVNWDNKYSPGLHAGEIASVARSIVNAEKLVERVCK
jgi:hypothetical protein